MFYVLLCVTLCPLWCCSRLGGKEGAGCFAWLVSLVSRGGGWLFLAVPWGCLRFVIVVFPDHAHLLFLQKIKGADQPAHPPRLISTIFICFLESIISKLATGEIASLYT